MTTFISISKISHHFSTSYPGRIVYRENIKSGKKRTTTTTTGTNGNNVSASKNNLSGIKSSAALWAASGSNQQLTSWPAICLLKLYRQLDALCGCTSSLASPSEKRPGIWLVARPRPQASLGMRYRSHLDGMHLTHHR